MKQDQKGHFIRLHPDGRAENLSSDHDAPTPPLMGIAQPRMQQMAALLNERRPHGALPLGGSELASEARWQPTA